MCVAGAVCDDTGVVVSVAGAVCDDTGVVISVAGAVSDDTSVIVLPARVVCAVNEGVITHTSCSSGIVCAVDEGTTKGTAALVQCTFDVSLSCSSPHLVPLPIV